MKFNKKLKSWEGLVVTAIKTNRNWTGIKILFEDDSFIQCNTTDFVVWVPYYREAWISDEGKETRGAKC